MFKSNYFAKLILFLLLSAGLEMSVVAGEIKTDFNGDGKADLFLRNAFTGAMSGWLINGSSVLRKKSYGKVLPSTGEITLGINDANGDGRSDLYWYNSKTGAVSTWLIKGRVRAKTTYGSLSRLEGWVPISLGDFNGDGSFDFLWYNAYSGQMQIWLINGYSVFKKYNLGTLPPKDGWSPIGVKDLSGNGITDIFLYNGYTGQTGAWLIYSNTVKTVSYGAVDPREGWRPVGLQDFNGDGKADLLWNNIYSGNVSSWLLSGSVLMREVYYGTIKPDSGWVLNDFGDFNGDGKTDLLFYKADTGNVAAWLLDDYGLAQKVGYGFLPPKEGWAPLGLDDFNGDNKADLIWQNFYTNSTTTWLLNGGGIGQVSNYGAIPASSVWGINIPRQ